jgi:hypothetical protein
MSQGPGIVQREIIRRARGAFTVRDVAQKLFVKIDRTKLGRVRRAMRGLETMGHLIREPGPLPSKASGERKRGDPEGYYRLAEKQQPERREWRRVPAPIRKPKRSKIRDRKIQRSITQSVRLTLKRPPSLSDAMNIWGTVGHPLARYCARNSAGEVVAVALFGRAHVEAAGLCPRA